MMKKFCLITLLLLFFNIVSVYAGERNLFFVVADNIEAKIYDIYSFDPVSQKSKKIISNGLNPISSPDGKKIAYFVFDGRFVNLAIANRDGSDAKQMKVFNRNPTVNDMAWSPDGKKIAFSNDTDITVSDLKNDPEILYTGTTQAFKVGWSSDGKHLMFWDMKKGTSIIDINTKERKQILPPSGGFPEFIPGTSTIVFLEKDKQPEETATLMMMNISKEKPEVLAKGVKFYGLRNNFKISGNGKKIAFLTTKMQEEKPDLSVVDISSKTIKEYKKVPCAFNQAVSCDGSMIAGLCKFPDDSIGYGSYDLKSGELNPIKKFSEPAFIDPKLLMYYSFIEWQK